MSTGTHTSLQASSGNEQATPRELFALTDEQILEIEPEGEVNVAPGFSPASSVARARGNRVPPPVISSEARNLSSSDMSGEEAQSKRDSSVASLPRNDTLEQSDPAVTEHGTRPTSHGSPEAPPWLAAQMNDPWTGADAKEFWNGVQQAQQEAAAYRAAFATPEDARALKELYPGGVNEARAAASRARLLDEIDGAYFGAAGKSPQDISAARANLAQHLLREDPAAFREMVFAALRALESSEKGTGASSSAPNLPRLAQVFSSGGADVNMAPATPSSVGARHAVPTSDYTTDAHMGAYAAFEKGANEELERSVGAAITRTLQQALPNLQRSGEEQSARARHAVPLHERLGLAVRQDVEAALKGDRQLGEQIAQILSARRFDNETRAQVVRLIDDRARQLVPSAAKRVINDWTHTTLAAHRSNASRSEAVSARREAEPVAAQGPPQSGLPAVQAGTSPTTFSSQTAQTRPEADPHRNASRSDARRLDYRKLSDEQILNL